MIEPPEPCSTMALAISPYSAPLARLGAVRSAGVTDLRFGSVLDDDWVGRDRFESGDSRIIVPLPADIACYAAAATLGRQMDDVNDRLFGDGLVPVASALGRHEDHAMAIGIGPARQWVAYGTGHLDLLGSRPVYERMKRWLGRATTASRSGKAGNQPRSSVRRRS